MKAKLFLLYNALLITIASTADIPKYEEVLFNFWSVAHTAYKIDQTYVMTGTIDHPLAHALANNITPEILHQTGTIFGNQDFCVLVDDVDEQTKQLVLNCGLTHDDAYPDMVLALNTYIAQPVDKQITIMPVTTEVQMHQWFALDAQVFGTTVQISEQLFKPFFIA